MKNNKTIFKYLYLFVVLFNVVLFAHYLSIVCSQIVSIPTYSIYEGVGLYFNLNKKRELFVYIIEVTFLFIVFNSFVFIYKRLNATAIICLNSHIDLIVKSKRYQIYFIVFAILLPLSALLIGSQKSVASFFLRLMIETPLMFILIAQPFYRYIIYKVNFFSNVTYNQNLLNSIVKIFAGKNIYIVLILICFSQLLYLLYDPIINKIKIVNEYYSIPEVSIIHNKYYDNSSYFNKAISSPITYKYDVIHGDYQGNTISYDIYKNKLLIENNSDLFQNSPNQIFYNKISRSISLNGIGPLSFAQEYISDNLFNLLVKNIVIDKKMNNNKYSDEVSDFLKINKYEIHQQVLSRFMIHHHNFMISPINEINLNRNYKEVNAQYGLGGAIIINKILSSFFGFSLQSWLKLCYVFYLLYFIIFVLVVYSVTKNIQLTAIIFILSIAVINNRGYDIILLPPGESPWRHFFDIIVLFFIHKFKTTDKIYYYIVSLLFSVLSVFINPQIGLMILLAAIATGIFYSYYENKNKIIISISSLISLVFGVLIYKWTSLATDFAKYYIDGLVGIEIPPLSILFIVSLFVVGYIALFKIIKDKTTQDYLSILYLFFYSQALLFYVAWHFDKNGITARFFIYILTLALLSYNIGFQKYIDKKIQSFINVFIIFVVLFYYTSSLINVMIQKNEYDDIFKTHKVYEWKIDKAAILSTMNPLYFEQSISLLQKYTPFSKGIYIISKFDNFIPFLSSRYSLMPFFDLSWYLITEQEVRQASSAIWRNKPEYIFVDSDIYRNYNNDIIDFRIPQIGYLSQESIWRVQRLKLLNRVFENISSDYTLVEKGVLLSVYKRKLQ